MNVYFLVAAVFSTFITGLHFFVGGRTIARPLLDAKSLADNVRCIQYFCWHIASLAILLLAVVFGVAAFVPEEISLAVVGTVLSTAIGILGISIPPCLKISYNTMPQGWLFVPVSALGIIGLL